jgi:hypothetical protein
VLTTSQSPFFFRHSCCLFFHLLILFCSILALFTGSLHCFTKRFPLILLFKEQIYFVDIGIKARNTYWFALGITPLHLSILVIEMIHASYQFNQPTYVPHSHIQKCKWSIFEEKHSDFIGTAYHVLAKANRLHRTSVESNYTLKYRKMQMIHWITKEPATIGTAYDVLAKSDRIQRTSIESNYPLQYLKMQNGPDER